MPGDCIKHIHMALNTWISGRAGFFLVVLQFVAVSCETLLGFYLVFLGMVV